MKQFPEKIRFIVKNFPYKYRDYAHIAAEALLAAGAQGKYWEMHDVLLKNSPFLGPKSLKDYAEELGLDTIRFENDLERGRYRGRVDEDIRLARSLGIYNTPTFFINGRRVIGNRSYEYLKAIIEEELQHVEQKTSRCTPCHRNPPVGPLPGDGESK